MWGRRFSLQDEHPFVLSYTVPSSFVLSFAALEDKTLGLCSTQYNKIAIPVLRPCEVNCKQTEQLMSTWHVFTRVNAVKPDFRLRNEYLPHLTVTWKRITTLRLLIAEWMMIDFWKIWKWNLTKTNQVMWKPHMSHVSDGKKIGEMITY